MTKFPTKAAADANDGELLPKIQRASIVIRMPTKAPAVDLAGYLLERSEHDTWKVFDGTDETAELVDEIVPRQFKSARRLTHYLECLGETTETIAGDLNAPEVA